MLGFRGPADSLGSIFKTIRAVLAPRNELLHWKMHETWQWREKFPIRVFI